MELLDAEKALELIKAPANRQEIENALRHEERLFLHTQSILEESKLPSRAYNNLIAWFSSFIDADKMNTFKKMIRLPLPTVDLTESIFTQLKKYQSAKDKFVKVEFSSDQYSQEFTNHLEEIEFHDFFNNEGFNEIKSEICSYLVIDLPENQLTSRPKPYPHILPLKKVIDVKRSMKSGAVEYIIFEDKKDRIVVIDCGSYFVFSKKDSDYSLIDQVPHSIYSENEELIEGLGWCPAFPLFDEPIPGSKKINQKSPITNVLSKLDWHVCWDTSKRYFDSYGAWPIIVSYKSKCEYRDAKGHECQDGYLAYYDEAQPDKQVVVQCPNCSASKLIGPGSAWEVNPPRDKDEADIIQKPVNIIEVSNDKLDWVKDEKDRQRQEIYFDCTGTYDGGIIKQKAINEDQVHSQFETQQAILDGIRDHFEAAEKFALETMGRLMFGDDFVKCTVYGGSEYFLITTEEILKEIESAKKAGIPQYELGNLRQKYVLTKNRNNPDQMQRAEILQQLEPYPDLSIMEMKNIGLDQMDVLNFVLKINFNTFIDQFEREYTNILEFGSLIDFKTKISVIQKKLIEYATEKKNSIPQPEPGRTERSPAA